MKPEDMEHEMYYKRKQVFEICLCYSEHVAYKEMGIILYSKYTCIPNREHVAVLLQSSTDMRREQKSLLTERDPKNALSHNMK